MIVAFATSFVVVVVVVAVFVVAVFVVAVVVFPALLASRVAAVAFPLPKSSEFALEAAMVVSVSERSFWKINRGGRMICLQQKSGNFK